jgi:hypothetical protein
MDRDLLPGGRLFCKIYASEEVEKRNQEFTPIVLDGEQAVFEVYGTLTKEQRRSLLNVVSTTQHSQILVSLDLFGPVTRILHVGAFDDATIEQAKSEWGVLWDYLNSLP